MGFMSKKKYDFLIVGAGFFGATCARLLTDKGYKCLILEKNKFVGGKAATERIHSIDIHLYGPHVFHTNYDEVWEFVTKYGKFNGYHHQVLNNIDGKMYHMPISMNTFYEFFGTINPKDAATKVSEEIKRYGLENPMNLEEQVCSNVGTTIYHTLIKPYTEKLWGKPALQLNTEILKNIPIRFNFDNSYFSEKYQGIPEDGYTALIENIIGDDIDIMLQKNFLDNKDKWLGLAEACIYTGPIDELCNYRQGSLEWRAIDFDIQNKSSESNNILGNSVIAYPDDSKPYFRATEYKWFTPERYIDVNWTKNSFVSYETAIDWKPGLEPMYPINNEETETKYEKYLDIVSDIYPSIIMGGRFGLYRCLSMSDTITAAMALCNNL